MPAPPISNHMAMKPIFRWLLAAVCMCMAVVLLTEGIRLSLGDTPVVSHCRSGGSLRVRAQHAWHAPAGDTGLVLGASTCAAAGLKGWVTWMVLKPR